MTTEKSPDKTSQRQAASIDAPPSTRRHTPAALLAAVQHTTDARSEEERLERVMQGRRLRPKDRR